MWCEKQRIYGATNWIHTRCTILFAVFLPLFRWFFRPLRLCANEVCRSMGTVLLRSASLFFHRVLSLFRAQSRRRGSIWLRYAEIKYSEKWFTCTEMSKMRIKMHTWHVRNREEKWNKNKSNQSFCWRIKWLMFDNQYAIKNDAYTSLQLIPSVSIYNLYNRFNVNLDEYSSNKQTRKMPTNTRAGANTVAAIGD